MIFLSLFTNNIVGLQTKAITNLITISEAKIPSTTDKGKFPRNAIDTNKTPSIKIPKKLEIIDAPISYHLLNNQEKIFVSIISEITPAVIDAKVILNTGVKIKLNAS